MSSDFRFHVASLAAVFVALGLGILIGTAFVSAPVVERQTRSLVQRLDAKVNDLRREARETGQNETALRMLLPSQIVGTLAGRSALLVRTGDYADAVDPAEASLRLAGATILGRVVLPPAPWRRRTAAQVDADVGRLAPLLAAAGRRAGAAGEDATAAAAAALEAYRRDGLLDGDVPGGAEDAAGAPPLSLVVFVGGARLPLGGGDDAAAAAAGAGDEGPLTDVLTLARRRDVALARHWQAMGITVVGVEPLDVDVSFVRVYQGGGLATVDNIERAAGQMALPFALRGEKAAYGMKPTAERVLPTSLERTAKAAAP